MLKKISLQELATIDGGRIQLAVDGAFRQIAVDCDDRPADTRARRMRRRIRTK